MTAARLIVAAALVASIGRGAVASQYHVGKLGKNCHDTCLDAGLNCNAAVQPGLASAKAAGVTCANANDTWPWSKEYEPAVDASNNCIGIDGPGFPQAVACQAYNESYRRICRCDPPLQESALVFGTGYSQGVINSDEVTMFAYTLGDQKDSVVKAYGAMTHFWLTPSQPGVTVKYYVDGESTASIQFDPALACGTGFDDTTAPWGNKLFGKGAKTGAWFWNFRVPFYASVRITMSAPTPSVLYTIFRGGLDVPIKVGGIAVAEPGMTPRDRKPRLMQTRVDATYQPQDFVDIANVPSGYSGLFFMQTLSVESGDMNFLEGCYHWFSPPTQAWPGVLLSTGTEDYFDSAYYFNGGQFRLPVAGETHIAGGGKSNITWSAYRFHEEDPLQFVDGVKLRWRNGDQSDNAGIKCLIESGGRPNGNPKPSKVRAYGWTYVWEKP